ncbi:MAG: hypothetical protein A2W31_08285 [Planctomycetes bacterium RBG_16_64_10]|nr:MAG: hypothetical protein A2W31_08285 [Planctomycetes bacterium RBG_16_64_10]
MYLYVMFSDHVPPDECCIPKDKLDPPLPEIAAATKIGWRMFPSEAQLARDVLEFMRREVDQRW